MNTKNRYAASCKCHWLQKPKQASPQSKTYSRELTPSSWDSLTAVLFASATGRRDKGASYRIQRLPLSAVAKCNSFASLDKGLSAAAKVIPIKWSTRPVARR